MTVEELLARCELVRASEKRLAECQPFSCGESDLNNILSEQSPQIYFDKSIQSPQILLCDTIAV